MKHSIAGMLLLAGVMALTNAHAADPGKYAVLSLVGDSLTIVTHDMGTTGSRVDQNRYDQLSLADPVYDRVAAKAIEESLKRIDARNSVVLLASSAPVLFREQGKLFEGSRVLLDPELGASLRGAGATHLLLVTKHRSETRVRTARSSVGSGFLEGLGFYVDRQLWTRSLESAERGQGFLGPFVYIKISLVDLSSSSILAEQAVSEARMVSAARSDDRDPWQALTPDEKANALRSLIVGEVQRVVPLLMSAPKR